jgi:DNA invertase Pin-like site-specific DNA recombinase
MNQYTFPPCDLPSGAPVVTYARVSPGPRQDITSLRDYLAAYVQYYRLNLVYPFEDRALSGGSVAGREGLAELVEFVTGPNAPRLAAILFYNTSRMARDMDDAQQIILTLRQHGHRVIFIQNPIPEGSVGRIVEAAYFFADQTFREQLRDAVKRGHKLVRQLTGPDGNPLGVYAGRIPFGFLTEKIDTGLVKNNGEPRILTRIYPDPQIASQILKAYQLRAQGLSYRRIEKQLQLFGYDLDTCTPEKKTECANLYKGLFRRPIYKGDYVYNEKVYLADGQQAPDGAEEKRTRKPNPITGGFVVKRYWEKSQVYKNFVTAIVPPDLWDLVQKQSYKRPEKGEKWPKLRHVRDGASRYHIFSGLTFCAHCGQKMQGYTQVYSSKSGDRLHRYCTCTSRTRRRIEACPNPNIKADEVEAAVIGHIFSIIDSDFIDRLVERVNEILSGSGEDDTLQSLQAKAEKLTKRREKLLGLVSEGDEPAEALYRELGSQLKGIEEEIEGLAQSQWTLEPLRVNQAQVRAYLEEIRVGLTSEDIEVKQNAANALLHRVEIGKNGQERFANLVYKSTIIGVPDGSFNKNEDGFTVRCSSMNRTLLNSENLLSFTIPIPPLVESKTGA